MQLRSLKKHKISVHEGVNVINVTLSFLDKIFLSFIKCRYIRVGVKYACNQCDSQFTQQGQLKQHKLSVHEGVRYPEAPTI